jgi:two-component system, NtrC family, response regulator AtoC
MLDTTLNESDIKCNILIVDDEPLISESITLIFKDEYSFESAFSAKECLEKLKYNDYDVILLDINLPDRSGLDIISEIKEYVPETLIIMITAYDDVQYAVSAFKRGIYDYIVKPFVSEKLRMIVGKATERAKLRKKLLNLQFIAEKQDQTTPLIGESKVMIQLKNHLREVAKYPDATVLITGESGTGKELVAQYIHKMSSRSNKELLDISTSSIPSNLLESELFGYEKGSFTDAKNQKIGLFERANGSTLFLDEIGTLSMDVQAKLLRVLENREIRRIGGFKKINIDIRLIAATNDNLEELIKQGRFREDLYYRLNVINIEVPPVRNRERDVLMLAEYFIERYNKSFRKNVIGMSDKLKQYLLEYNFPGNVRELKNLIERGMIICKEKSLSLSDIQLFNTKETPSRKDITIKLNQNDHKKLSDKASSAKKDDDDLLIKVNRDNILTLKELEKLYITEVLKHFDGSKKITAETLDISRSSLYERLKRNNIKE